jgi:hypothetical protein
MPQKFSAGFSCSFTTNACEGASDAVVGERHRRLGLLWELDLDDEVRRAVRADPALEELSKSGFLTWMSVVSLAGRNPHGLTWATRQTIGRRRSEWASRGNSEAAVKNHLRELEQAGLIVRFREDGLHRAGHPLTAVYTVLMLARGPFRQGRSPEARQLIHGWDPRNPMSLKESFTGPHRDPAQPARGRRRVRLEDLIAVNADQAGRCAASQGPPPGTLLAGHLGTPTTRQNQSWKGRSFSGLRASAAMCGKPGAEDRRRKASSRVQDGPDLDSRRDREDLENSTDPNSAFAEMVDPSQASSVSSTVHVISARRGHARHHGRDDAQGGVVDSAASEVRKGDGGPTCSLKSSTAHRRPKGGTKRASGSQAGATP